MLGWFRCFVWKMYCVLAIALKKFSVEWKILDSPKQEIYMWIWSCSLCLVCAVTLLQSFALALSAVFVHMPVQSFPCPWKSSKHAHVLLQLALHPTTGLKNSKSSENIRPRMSIPSNPSPHLRRLQSQQDPKAGHEGEAPPLPVRRPITG